jgi:hypothetical protein
LLVMLPAVTVNKAVVAPEATVTEVGVESSGLLSESDTAVPPVEELWLNVTVQDALPPVVRIPGVHDKELRVAAPIPPGPVTVPPVAATESAVPAGDATLTLLTPTEVEATPEAIVRFTVATTPLAMAAEFKPYATQV